MARLLVDILEEDGLAESPVASFQVHHVLVEGGQAGESLHVVMENRTPGEDAKAAMPANDFCWSAAQAEAIWIGFGWEILGWLSHFWASFSFFCDSLVSCGVSCPL